MGFKRQTAFRSCGCDREKFSSKVKFSIEIQKENEIEKYIFSNQRTGILHNISQQELNRLQGLYIQ